MIEREGIAESVDPWRTDVPAKIIDEIGMEKTDVRGRRSRCVRVLHQKLRCRCEPFRRSPPDRVIGMPAQRHLGDEEFVETSGDVQEMTQHE
jgi:hypothetical protein